MLLYSSFGSLHFSCVRSPNFGPFVCVFVCRCVSFASSAQFGEFGVQCALRLSEIMRWHLRHFSFRRPKNYNVIFVWQMRSFHPQPTPIVSSCLTIFWIFLHSHLNPFGTMSTRFHVRVYTLCPVFMRIYFRSNCLHCAEYLFLRLVR